MKGNKKYREIYKKYKYIKNIEKLSLFFHFGDVACVFTYEE